MATWIEARHRWASYARVTVFTAGFCGTSISESNNASLRTFFSSSSTMDEALKGTLSKEAEAESQEASLIAKEWVHPREGQGVCFRSM